MQQSFYHSATFRDTFLINGKTVTQPDEWDMYGMAAMSSPGHKYNFGSLWIATTKGSNFENGEGTCRFGIYGAQSYGDWEELDQFKAGSVGSSDHTSEYHEVVESRDGPLSTFVNFEGLESEME